MDDNKVIEYLENRVVKNPKSLLFARLADNYIARGRIEEAVKLCQAGIKYHPEYITGYLILSKAYLIKEDFEKAETELKKVLSRDRHYIAAHKYLADLMLKMGWENTAAMHYRDILKIDPLNAEATAQLEKLDIPNLASPIEELHIEPDFLEEEPPANFKPSNRYEEDVLLDELEEVFNSSEAEIQDEEDLTESHSPSFWPDDAEQKQAADSENIDDLDDTAQEDIMIDSIEPVTATVSALTDQVIDTDQSIEKDELETIDFDLDINSDSNTKITEKQVDSELDDIDDKIMSDIKTLDDIDSQEEQPDPNQANVSEAIESVFKNVTPITETETETSEQEEKMEGIQNDKDMTEDSEDILEDISNMPEFLSSEDQLPVDLKTPTPAITGTSVDSLKENSTTEDDDLTLSDLSLETENIEEPETGLEDAGKEISEPQDPELPDTIDEEIIQAPEPDPKSQSISEPEIAAPDTELEQPEDLQSEKEIETLPDLEAPPEENLTDTNEESTEETIEKQTEPETEAFDTATEQPEDLQSESETEKVLDSEPPLEDTIIHPEEDTESKIESTDDHTTADNDIKDKQTDQVSSESNIFEPELMSDTSIGENITPSENKSSQPQFNEEDFEIDEFSNELIKEADETPESEKKVEKSITANDDDFDFSLEILEEIDRHIEEASQAAKNSFHEMNNKQDQETEAPQSEPEPEPETTKQAEPVQEPSLADQADASQPSGKESKIVSPTLGEIYVAQGEYAKAIKVYEVLLDKHPDEPRYQKKINDLKQKLDSSEEE